VKLGITLSATSTMYYSSLSPEELVRACAELGNAEAWEEFVRRFQKMIGTVVLRIARRYGESSGTIVDDLIQETYVKVCADNCRLLREFQPHHPDAFFGMLKVTAANVTHDYFRARRSSKRGSGLAESDLTAVESTVPDSRSAGASEIEREILLHEIDKVLTDASSASGSRDREIFWLYYRQGYTANAIAAIRCYQLTTKGVESIIFRLTRQVRVNLVDRERGRQKRETGA
jgi:RNA polymerase sigma-70 factor (ECF subfamily)